MASDHNDIASYLGMKDRIDGLTICGARTYGCFGGFCWLAGKAEALKREYSSQHNLEYQDIPAIFKVFKSELTFRQIKREHFHITKQPLRPMPDAQQAPGMQQMAR